MHLKTLVYLCKQFWNLGQLYLCLVCAWVYSALVRLLEVSLIRVTDIFGACVSFFNIFVYCSSLCFGGNLAFSFSGKNPLHFNLYWFYLSLSFLPFLLGHYNGIMTMCLYSVQERLCVLLPVSCMEKVPWCIMMRKEKMDY